MVRQTQEEHKDLILETVYQNSIQTLRLADPGRASEIATPKRFRRITDSWTFSNPLEGVAH